MNKIILLAPILLLACSSDSMPVVSAPEPEPAVVAEEAIEVAPPARVEILMGLTPTEVIRKMGAPNLVRRDNLAQVMLFEHEACVFDIVFYAESVGAPFRVSYISARTRQGLKSDEQHCLILLKPEGFNPDKEREE